MNIFRDLGWFFKQEKKAYIIGILLLIAVALLQLVPPRVIGWAVDAIESKSLSKETLLHMVIFLGAAAVGSYGMRYMWRVMIFGAAVKLARQMRNKLYEHFTKMNQTFYQNKRTGDLMAHATNDIQAIQQTAGIGVLTLADSVITGGVVLITMAVTISWKLTIISLLPMPLMAWLTSKYGTMLHKRFGEAQAAFSSLNDKVQESITGVKVVKTFGKEASEVNMFTRQSADVVEKNMKVARIDALFDPTISFIVSWSFLFALIFGSRMVVSNEITLGELVTFTTYLGLLVWPMLAFGWLFNIVERGRASYDRVFALLQEKNEIVESDQPITKSPKGAIVVKVNRFVYPGTDEVVLKDIHFALQEGQTLGIVGKTGAGKTTLLKLLIREFDLTVGDIYFDQHSIKSYSFDSLYNSIGYVPQDHFLFSTTVGENIAFSNLDAPHSDIERVAQLAHVHEDIMCFTHGYDTIVGEKGVSLSGGQKQRLSIARALLQNPQMLFLDDSLSAVDGKTEALILKSLKQHRRNKTTVITTHRLSAVAHADLILVIEGGQIIQRGRHEELLEAHGWYQEMYKRQQLEKIVEAGGYKYHEK